MDDLHFMERLDRVAWRETELALRLYREPGLVRLLLDDAKAADAPRIAIALAEGPASPHVIVARDGAFVTCLASGMAVGDAPVVAHHRITVAADRHEVLKGRLAYIDWAVDNVGSVRRLWRSVLNDAHRVPREAILALLPLVNLFGGALVDLWMREDRVARELVYDNTNRFTRPRARLTSADVDVLNTIWRKHWAVGHLMGLYGLLDRPYLDAVAEHANVMEEPRLLQFYAMRFGFWPTAMRGAWLAARIGPSQLRVAKAVMRAEHLSLAERLGAAMVVGFLGASSSKYRAEAAKALDPGPAPAHDVDVTAGFSGCVATGLEPTLLTDRAGGRARIAEEARELAQRLGHTFEPERVDLLAFATANYAISAYGGDAGGILMVHLGWLARADLPEFYPLEDWVRAIPAWRPEDTVTLIKNAVGIGTWRSEAPTPQAPRPGRNAPCPCGSGKKYKRCCAA